MRLFLALVVALLVALSGCGSGDERSGQAGTGTGPSELLVQQLYDTSRGSYFEGSYSYVRIERLNGDGVVERRLRDSDRTGETVFASSTVFRVASGEYRLVSYQRPCDGLCDVLDPPTDRCSREVTLHPEATLAATVTVRPGHGCSIRLS